MTASQDEGAPSAEHESEEEERFFSQPPEPEEEHTSPSLDVLALRRGAPAEVDGARQLELSRLFERRARLQRRVALWLGVGSAVILLAAFWRHRAEARPVAGTLHAAQIAPTAREPSPLPSPVVSAAPSAHEIAVTPTPSASAAQVVSEAASTPAPASDLLARASKLLSAGRTRDGVDSARAAIAADPLDARAYVLLAAGLEDLGDWAGARAAFVDCRKQATRGPSSTCNYFARR